MFRRFWQLIAFLLIGVLGAMVGVLYRAETFEWRWRRFVAIVCLCSASVGLVLVWLGRMLGLLSFSLSLFLLGIMICLMVGFALAGNSCRMQYERRRMESPRKNGWFRRRKH